MPLQFDQETAQERLNEVYERQNQISASSAESRASKILHGLGFNTDMQRRPTQSFRCVACSQIRCTMCSWKCGAVADVRWLAFMHASTCMTVRGIGGVGRCCVRCHA
eukprot:1146717-Pelagomonas_calceolata.AAC.11